MPRGKIRFFSIESQERKDPEQQKKQTKQKQKHK